MKDNINVEVIKAGKTGLFCNYIFKAIPLAFDESMSYYECLCGLLNYLKNTIIPTVNNNAEAVAELQKLFTKLQEYVNNYFDNLDVQDEINNKLDQMVEDGTLNNYICKYINPYLSTFNDRLDKQDKKISAVESGAPLVASSTSAMTDTSKVYVNTSDGYWYYYNGSNWVRGDVYQASQPSDEIQNISKYIPQFCKAIIYNTLYINTDDEKLTVKTNNSIQIWFIGNKTLQLTDNIDLTFAYTDYNINKNVWALVINQSKEIKLKQINTNDLDVDDMIIMIFAKQNAYQYSLITNNLYYNNKPYVVDGTLSHYVPQMIVDVIYGKCEINTDDTNITVNLIGEGQQKCFFISPNHLLSTGNITETSPALFTFPLTQYNINTGTWFIVWDALDNIVKIISGIERLEYYQSIIMIITYKNSEHITLSKSNVYFNGKDITINGIKNKINKLENEVSNLSISSNYDFLRCFKNFTFIGDSLMAGYTSVDGHIINSANAKAQNNNWCSYLCNRLNREFKNLSVGSSTIHNWRYGDQSGQTESNIENANIDTGIYFVGLGVNDLRQNLAVGTNADINTNDYTKNANSVYGNYDYIINKLKEFNPYAKIFVFTIPNSEQNPESINNAIKYVANLYSNVYCIDLNTLYDYNSGFIANNFTKGHYNPITYNYMSLLIEKAVNDYIFNNSKEFDLVPYNF